MGSSITPISQRTPVSIPAKSIRIITYSSRHTLHPQQVLRGETQHQPLILPAKSLLASAIARTPSPDLLIPNAYSVTTASLQKGMKQIPETIPQVRKPMIASLARASALSDTQATLSHHYTTEVQKQFIHISTFRNMVHGFYLYFYWLVWLVEGRYSGEGYDPSFLLAPFILCTGVGLESECRVRVKTADMAGQEYIYRPVSPSVRTNSVAFFTSSLLVLPVSHFLWARHWCVHTYS